jgi:hypothetical protein
MRSSFTLSGIDLGSMYWQHIEKISTLQYETCNACGVTSKCITEQSSLGHNKIDRFRDTQIDALNDMVWHRTAALEPHV